MNQFEKYLEASKKTRLIFDFDQTLFKIIINWDSYFESIERELVIKDKKIYNNYLNESISWCDMQNFYVKKYGPEMKKLICDNNIKSENSHSVKVVPNNFLMNFIKNSNNFHLYIWSSNTKKLIKSILDKYQILDKFTKIICRDDVDYLKPNPEGFSKIYLPEVDLKKYLLIGDSLNDYGAASNCGIDFYKIDYFHQKKII